MNQKPPNQPIEPGLTDANSDQKQLREALEASESRLRRAERVAGFGHWEVDLKTKRGSASKGAQRIYGMSGDSWPLDEIQSLPLLPFRPLLDDALRQLVHEGKPYDIEFQIQRQSDGKILDIHSMAEYDPEKEIVFGVIQDISARKSAENQLRESEARYRFMTENMTDVIWQMDADLRFTYISPTIEKQTGHKPCEVIGHTLYDFVPDNFHQIVREKIENRQLQFHLNSHLETGCFQFELLRKDGSMFWVEIISNPVFDENHTLNGFQGVNRDITDRKKLEEDQLEMERRLLHGQKLESLGIMAGGIAHDFNNLLAAILGNLELAMLDVPSLSSAHESIAQAVQASKRAADLTRQMLAYSGKGKFVVKKLNLSELLEENAHMLRAAVSKTATFHLELEKDLPLIQADPGQIQQIIANLITNSSEAIGHDSGVINLKTGIQVCDEEYLRGSVLGEKPAPGSFVWLEVTDTGCGMTSEIMKRMFDPFFSTKFAGRGLGMSAVQGIVLGHKGALFLKTETGKGTTIRILFPSLELPKTSEKSAGSSKELSRLTDASQQAGLVLIVDDEEILRITCSALMKRLGFSMITARDGGDALRVFEANLAHITFVLLDLTMPKMSGEKVFEEMCRLKPDIRVILMTGYSEKEVEERFTERKPAAILQKPFDLHTLRTTVQRILSKP